MKTEVTKCDCCHTEIPHTITLHKVGLAELDLCNRCLPLYDKAFQMAKEEVQKGLEFSVTQDRSFKLDQNDKFRC